MGFGSGGGSGSGSIAGASDASLSNPATNDVLQYDSAVAKWKNEQQSIQNTDSFPVRVYHGSDASVARPSVPNPVDWVGSVEPTHMAENDLWFEVSQPVSTSYPFDTFAVPTIAYSLRRLVSSYIGPAVRVRRSSDNTEQNIGFSASGALDSGALVAFAGSGSAFVTIWYDQSGNGRNFVQTTVAAQPRIVSSGVIDQLNNLPAITFDGTSQYLAFDSAVLYASGSATIAAVWQAQQSANATVFGEVGASTQNSYRLARIGAGSASPIYRASTIVGGTSVWQVDASGDTTFNGTPRQSFIVDTGSALSYWRDSTAVVTNAAAIRGATPALVRTSFGAAGYNSPSGFAQAAVQELVAWGSNQSTDRVAISTNQQSYWGTP